MRGPLPRCAWRRLRDIFRGLRRSRDGGVLIEMGMAIPVLLTLMLGGVEVARYVLLHQKLDRVASSMADLVSQAETISAGDLLNVFDAARYVARPFDLSAGGAVIISSISNPLGSGDVRVNWQQSGAGTGTAASRFGAPGGSVTLPAGFTLADGQTIIVAEVFYDYVPWVIGNVTGPGVLYQRALLRPRYGGLTILNP